LLLTELDSPAEAVSATQEAVQAYRELAVTLPDRHRRDVARSLRALGLVLDTLGQTTEAEDARREADLVSGQ
jgi:hypothetical protein